MAAKAITTTGIKGFLQWYQREQPHIFAKIAPKLPTAAPAAFGALAGKCRQINKQLSALYKDHYLKRATSQNHLSDYGSYAAYTGIPSYVSNPVTVDYTAQLSANPISYSSSATPSYSAYSSGAISNPTPSMPSIADSASPGLASTGTTSAISSLIGAASVGLLTAAQIAQQNQLVQTQLTRAQSGLAPLNSSLSKSGVPVVGGSTSMLLLLAALAGGALLLMD